MYVNSPIIPPRAQLEKYLAENGSILPKGRLFSDTAIFSLWQIRRAAIFSAVLMRGLDRSIVAQSVNQLGRRSGIDRNYEPSTRNKTNANENENEGEWMSEGGIKYVDR
jgi:hypothetical protein